MIGSTPLGTTPVGGASLSPFVASAMIERTVFLGQDIVLFMPPPDWRSSVELTARLIDEIEAGQTGRENRRSRAKALRHEVAATWTLPQAETAELQAHLWLLGAAFVGIPMPQDVLDVATWSDRICDSEWVLNYDENGWAIYAKDEVPEAPPWANLAPLMVGRLEKRPQLAPVDENSASLSLKLIERSPWDFRITPQLGAITVPADWPTELAANWSELPVDSTEDVLILEDRGDGRVQAVDGIEGTTRRRQQFVATLDRVGARRLLLFFLARQGRVQSWEAPWMLRPADDLPETPHTTTARFASDSITLKFASAETADATIDVVQVPWEIEPLADEAPAQVAVAYLYRITMAAPGSPVWRFTSWEHDLTRTEDAASVTYLGDLRGFWEHDKITKTINLSDDPVTLSSWIFEGNPLLRIVQRAMDVPLSLEILSCDPETPEAASVVYSGEIASVTNTGRSLQAATSVLGGLLDVKVPAFPFGAKCSYEFCGAGCTLNKVDFTFEGTVVSESGLVLTVLETMNPQELVLNTVTDFFARGWIKRGTGEDFEIRQIVRSTKISDPPTPTQEFTLKRAFRNAVVGETVTFIPSCTGTRLECEFKYNNYINFGGHPHIGPRNLSVPQRSVSTQGGKK